MAVLAIVFVPVIYPHAPLYRCQFQIGTNSSPAIFNITHNGGSITLCTLRNVSSQG
jgi:hypothetical protein